MPTGGESVVTAPRYGIGLTWIKAARETPRHVVSLSGEFVQHRGGPMGRSLITPSVGMAVSVLVLISGVATAQWSGYPLKNIPLRADGKPDLSAPVPRTKDG